MFATIANFYQTWKNESEATGRILDALTDQSLGQAVSDKDRTLGRIAWHLVTTIPELLERTGLVLDSINHDAPVPSTAKDIAHGYRLASSNLMEAVEKQWTDETLLEAREMYGETWTIGTTLTVLIHHQIHHRGQMTVLMRQAGLQVPGIYGPSREEWSAYGMEAPPV